MIVPEAIVMEPSQSIALMPARKGVFGVSMSRYISMMMKARPSKGTECKRSDMKHGEVKK